MLYLMNQKDGIRMSTTQSKDMMEDFVLPLEKFGNHGIQEEMENAETEQNSKTYQNREEIENSETEQNREIEQETKTLDVQIQSPLVLRRSKREINKPKYLNDYVLLSEEEGERLLLCLNAEPRDFYEAKDSQRVDTRV